MILGSITHTQAHWLPSSLLTQLKKGIKDLIHSHYCLPHPPDSCLLTEPKAAAMMHRYSPSLLKAPTRHCEWFSGVLWVASAKDWKLAHIMIGECLQTRRCQRKGMCISVVMTSSAQAVTVRAIWSGKVSAFAMGNHRKRLEWVIQIRQRQEDAASVLWPCLWHSDRKRLVTKVSAIC